MHNFKQNVILQGMLIVLFLLGIQACKQSKAEENQTYLLQSTSWYQQSAEMKALYYQAFNWAEILLKEKTRVKSEKPQAVVLDIDETVLDNSPSTACQIIEDIPFSETLWEDWCSKIEAEALPGALEFTLYADKLGVEVFYISNRVEILSKYTIANLEKLGFPNADSIHILLKNDTSSKDLRREIVREKYDIILFIGDNLGDFDGSFDKRTNDIAKKLVKERSDRFGTEYIILPNPMYGSWERPFRTGDGTQTENKVSALKSFR